MQDNPVRKSPPESGFWGVIAGATVYCVTFAEFPHLSDGRKWQHLSYRAVVRIKWTTYLTQHPARGYHATYAGYFFCKVIQFSSVQSLSPVRLFATPWTAARQASLSITNSCSPPKRMSIELMMPSNHLILCRPLLLLPLIPPSIRVFPNESALRIRWPKYWNFSFNISPSNEHSGLISFRVNWVDLLAVQGTLKSLLQHHSSKASILWHSAFFIVQLSHSYMTTGNGSTTGKTIALTRQTFVGKLMSLLFNMQCRLLIAFLPRSKCLLISWLQSSSAVILEPRKVKSASVSTVSPSVCHEIINTVINDSHLHIPKKTKYALRIFR